MKKRLIAFVFIFYFLLYFFITHLDAESAVLLQNSEPNISLDFQDAGLKDALKVFSMQSGLNFIASEGVQERKITLYLDNVPLKKAMDKLFKLDANYTTLGTGDEKGTGLGLLLSKDFVENNGESCSGGGIGAIVL